MREPSVFKKLNERRAKSPWCCRWVEYDQGKPKRREKHYSSEAKARAKKKALLDAAKEGRREYSDSEYQEIDHAWTLCGEHDVSLLDMVRAGLESMAIDLDAEKRKVPTINWAIEAYLYDGEKRNLRPDTLKDYKALLSPFMVGREDRLVSTVTGAELLAYILNKYSNETSRTNLRSRLGGWMNFCAAKEQGWVKPLPKGALAWKSAQGDKADPVIYSVDEAQMLINQAPDYLKCGVAVGLFAGVRPKGLMRICWSFKDAGGVYGIDFKRKVIRLHPSWVKTRGGRTLHDLPDNLWLWLKRYRDALPLNGRADAGERLVPLGEEKWYKQLRFALAAVEIDKGGAKDVMRHSFGSYGRHRGLDWVIDTLGHTEGMKVFNEHYKNSAASPAESERYFAIVPPASQ